MYEILLEISMCCLPYLACVGFWSSWLCALPLAIVDDGSLEVVSHAM